MSDPVSDPTTAASDASLPALPRRPKSPPLAFEKTPNDALLSCCAPTTASPSQSAMGRQSPSAESLRHLQAIVDKQSDVIEQLHRAFVVEREAWHLERQRFYSRIQSLEHLLNNGGHHSPAKSPIASPASGVALVSPHARALHATSALPTIAEDENILQPLSARRENAPQSIHLPSLLNTSPDEERPRRSLVSFPNDEGLQVEDIPAGRPQGLSPPPPMNRIMAGHTPIRPPRPPTPPPNDMAMDGIEDTPTRNNTHINLFLTQHNDGEGDVPLKGPLNMPELPHRPDDTNFTLDALTEKLRQIEQHPEESESKPLVMAQPSPGLASPTGETDLSPESKTAKVLDESPFSPVNSAKMAMSQMSSLGSNLSPSMSNDGVLSPQEVHEAKVQQQFEEGGIKLKKKLSLNFGTPLGLVGSFTAHRKQSGP